MSLYPTAPPVYTDFNGSNDEIVEKEIIQSHFLLHPLNDICIICNKTVVEENHEMVIKKCRHVYHLDCHIRNNYPYCIACNKDNDIDIDEIEDQIKVINFSDSETVEKVFKKKEIQNELSKEAKLTQLSFESKVKLIGKNNAIRDKNKKIDLTYLKENNIGFDEIIEAKINVATLYYLFGATEWQNLLELGLKKSHLKKKSLLNINYLIELYQVTYEKLKMDLDVSIQDIISLKYKAFQLRTLGLYAKDLINGGLKKSDFLSSKDYISFKDWRLILELRKKHMYQLGLNGIDIQFLGWSIYEFSNEIKLNQRDKEHFNLSRVTFAKK